MDQFVVALRPYAEILGFVKDAIVAAAVLFGLQQVILAKKSLDTANSQRLEDQQRAIKEHERASKTVALEYAQNFVDVFGRKYLMFVNELSYQRLPPYTGSVGDFTFESIPSSFRSTAYRRSQMASSSGALDALEVFAAAHTSGVADEGTGFELNGRMFCLAVQQDLYDLLCIEQTQGYYGSIVELYKVWSPRIAREKLVKSKELLDLQKATIEKDKAALDKELESLAPIARTPPIGMR